MKYKCHKIVDAFLIMDIQQGEDDTYVLTLDDTPNFDRPVTSEWFTKHDPTLGGYFVEYENGYTSYSPAAPFEDGYAPLTEVVAQPDDGPFSAELRALIEKYVAAETPMSQIINSLADAIADA